MFWEGQQQSLTVQFLQFIDWKTKTPPPPHIHDELLSVVGTVDIVGLHLLTHILKEYYYDMCHVLTLELDLEDLINQDNYNNNNNNDQHRIKKIITESVLIVTKLCSVICKMPNLQSLHLSFNNFPKQCYKPCIQMFNLGITNRQKTKPSSSLDQKEQESKSNLDNGPNGYLFSGGNDVFPSLQQIFLNSSIFYVNEANDDFIMTPINDYNMTDLDMEDTTTSGYWSDDDNDKAMTGNINIEQLMNDYNIHQTQGGPLRMQNQQRLMMMDNWQCGICTLINNGQFIDCSACGEPRQLYNDKKKNNGDKNGDKPQAQITNAMNVYQEDDDIDDEKLLSIDDDDQKSAYYPFLSFLTNHQHLTSASIHLDKRGKNGISLVNRILLSIAKRKKNLNSFYLDCGALHLNYCIKYLVLAIKQHSLRRFSCNFFAMDERSVTRLIDGFNSNPHKTLSFFSVHGAGVQYANQSINGLIEFVDNHRDLEYLKLNYFTGINYINQNWSKFTNKLLELQTLSYIAFGEILVDNNEIMNNLCRFIQKCTTLQSVDISISQKSYEGYGGSLENTKKFIFYAFKNQIFLQSQIEETEGCLEVCWKMPVEIIELVVGFAYDISGRFNININGLPEGDFHDVGNQFMKLKQSQSSKWRVARDLQLFTHL